MPEMADDEFRNAVHAICARLQSDFEAELTRLTERLGAERQSAVAEARQQAEALVAERTAEAALAAAQAVQAAQAEWSAKLEQQQQRADDHLLEELSRLRGELEEQAAKNLAAREAELTQAFAGERAAAAAALEREQASAAQMLEAERTSARQLLDAERGNVAKAVDEERANAAKTFDEERAKLSKELDALRAAHQHELDTERTRHAGEIAAERDRASSLAIDLEHTRAAAAHLEAAQRRIAEMTHAHGVVAEERDAARRELTALQSQPVAAAPAVDAGAGAGEFAERLLAGVRTIDSARSLSDALTALTTAAGTFAPRAAVFVVQGGELQAWRQSGFGDALPANQRVPSTGLLGRAITTVNTVSTKAEPAPPFAGLAGERLALAVPVTVGGQAVAALYADAGSADEDASSAWPAAMQLLAAHASTCLAHLTAYRTAQALQGSRQTGAARGPAAAEDESSARRYARLLVSEIKLYNESAVRLGREKRDLLTRLRPEIDRARQLFDERVSPAIAKRHALFHDELVHTLADGDSALLGSA